MRNMSEQFYNYLAKKATEYFKAVGVKNGDRFDIQFEKEEDVKSLYAQIAQVVEIGKFTYRTKPDADEYETYSFSVAGIDIIVAATINGIQPDYLTKLRNEVGGSENSKFNNTAILFIHNTTLDSIVGGAISFKKEGMPFHISSIVNDIRKELSESKLDEGQKAIIEFELDKNKSLSEEGLSLLQFEELLKIINKETIEEDDYRNLGLFYDQQLQSFDKKEALERIRENSETFARIDSIHKFQGDIPSALEKFLDPKGVEELSKPDAWDDKDFSFVKTSIEAKISTKKVQYEGYELFNIEEENFWDKPDKETEAGKRKRRIIIFNPNKETKIQFSFKFDEKIAQKEVNVDKNQEATAKASGKKVLIEIEHEVGKVSFNSIKIKASENYEFKIVVLDIDSKMFRDTELQTGFNFGKDKTTKENVITLNTEQSEFILNQSEDTGVTIELTEQNEDVLIDSLNSKFKIVNNVQLDENIDTVRLNIILEGIRIPLSIRDEGNTPVRISGYSVWVQKREEKKDFKYIEDRLIQGSRTYFATEDFRVNLKREEKIIKDGSLYFLERGGELIGVDIDVAPKLRDSYNLLINYFRVYNILPSLAYYSEELSELAISYVKEFINVIDGLEEGGYVNDTHIDLSKVGVVKLEGTESLLLLSPLHPLNIMYEIVIHNEVGSERLHESLTKKLESLYLLPYLAEDKVLYKPLEQNHSKEWKYFVKNDTLKYKSSRKFVSKLVKEKIEEFVEHFSYLFEFSPKAPIKINLINTGDSKEVLQGIISFYVASLRNINPSELRDIYVNIYSKEDSSVFEELSYYDTVAEVEENLLLDLEPTGVSKNYLKEDILSICREKIKFYRKDLGDSDYDYCHIAFYEMDPNVEVKDCKLNHMITGASLDGIISGVPSRFINDSYMTGFGSKYMSNSKGNLLLNLTSKLNSLYRSVHFGLSFSKLECLTTVISQQDKEKLDKIYNSSNWVTFIEPKVDLKFFKNDSKSKDLLIIHYSDQYTSSSGYDAITVTRKSEQYELVIREFLKDKNITVTDELVIDVINCFNAVNGDWLLRLISDKGQFPREKLSIISAIKLSMAHFYHKDIIWIPISLEEVLRVSRGAGLSGSDGLFSVKNLKGDGQYSDDLLLIGIDISNEEIKVHYYPVEVKIGENQNSVINKAKKQAYKTRNYFEKHLIEDDETDETRRFAKKMYRNFMMQLAIVAAEKMKLYDVWKEQNWDAIVDSDVRRKLLNDEYIISNDLDNVIGRGAIMSFKKGLIFSKSDFVELSQTELGEDYYEDEFNKGSTFLELSFTERLGYGYITADTEKLKNDILNSRTDIDSTKLLAVKYGVDNKILNHHENANGQETGDTSYLEPDKGTDPSITAAETKGRFDSKNVKDYSAIIGKEITIGDIVAYDPKRLGNPLSNMNVMITGSSGKGKTQLLKSMIIQQRKKGTNLMVFDFKNDFGDKEFLEMGNLKYINLEFKGLPYNPLIPPLKVDDGVKLMNVGEHILAICGVFKQVYKLGPQQEASLKNSFRGIYKENGINPRINEVSEDSPILYPIIDDIADILEESDDKAYSRMDTLFNYGLFRASSRNVSLVELLNDSYVFNLSSISNDEVKNAIAKIIVVSTHQYMNTLPHSPNDIKNIFVFDEAHRFLGEPSLEKLARECRAYGMAIWLSSQYPTDYPDEISGCLETKIIHGNGDDEEKIKAIKRLINYDGDSQNLSKLGLFQAVFNNPHYSKKFINTLGFPHLLLLKEIEEKGSVTKDQIESIEEVRKDEVISYLLKLQLIYEMDGMYRSKEQSTL